MQVNHHRALRQGFPEVIYGGGKTSGQIVVIAERMVERHGGFLATRHLLARRGCRSVVFLGPLVLVALWPWLWFDTYAHLRAWLTFHLDHVHYNFEYLGENWNAPLP